MAEKEGFEPSIRDKPDTPLAGERLRPLGHFSNYATQVYIKCYRAKTAINLRGGRIQVYGL